VARRGWIVVVTWASDRLTADDVFRAALLAIYRAAFAAHVGTAHTLGALLEQEGLAARFAGIEAPAIDAPSRAAARRVIDPLRGASDYPTLFSCWCGDAAATKYGYAPLGLPEHAGLAVALDDAQRRAEPPEAVLIGGRRID
jgi:hypothetical protein